MRLYKIPLILLIVLTIFSGDLFSQTTNQYLDCANVSHSTADTMRVVNLSARPGDTAWIQISMKNYDNPNTAYSELTSAFNVLLKFDPAYLTPIIVDPLDPSEPVMVLPTGRFKTIIDDIESTYDVILNLDNYLFANISQSAVDTNVIVIQATPVLHPSYVTYPPPMITAGSGPVLLVPFLVNSGMPDGTTTSLNFYEVNECVVQGADIFCANCRLTEYSVRTLDSVNTSVTPPDSVFREAPVWPTTRKGTFTALLNPPPVISEYYASPSSVTAGSSTVLFWNVTNSESISILGPNLNFSSTNLNSATSVTPPATVGSYTYTLTAYNADTSVTANASITVTTGGGGDPTNNAPVISVGSSFTVEEGQLLSFTVSATDADNNTITLSALSLPNNAVFNSAVGAGSVSSIFSWTPDIGQKGTYSVTFTANDTKTTTSSTVSIIVTEIKGDKLFSTSAIGSNPVGGLKGKKGIKFPINLVTSQTVYGIQFDLIYDYENFKIDSIVTTPRTLDYVVYDNIGQTPGVIKIVTFGLANEPIQTDVSTAILQAYFSIDSLAAPGDYPVYIEDGWESINPDPAFPSLELLLTDGVIQVDLPGDVNLDKRIDVADLVSIVAYIIGDFGLPERQFEVADVILNDTVDVFDLVGVINLVYGNPVQPAAPGQEFAYGIAKVALDYSDMATGVSDDIIVTSELPVDIGGVQLEIKYDPAIIKMGKPIIAPDADNLQLITKDNQNGRMIILMHLTNPFNENALISAGDADLVTIPVMALDDIESGNAEQIKITRALLSTANAAAVSVDGFNKPLPETFVLKQNYPNPFNPITTIEFSLGMGDGSFKQVNLDIYNILGRHVKALVDNELSPGNYRVEWDATDKHGIKTSTGIYLYRLKVGSEIQTKKMLLLK